MNDDHLIQSAHLADFLVAELREVHKSFCKDKPNAAELFAEQYALGLLNQSVALAREIKAVQP